MGYTVIVQFPSPRSKFPRWNLDADAVRDWTYDQILHHVRPRFEIPEGHTLGIYDFGVMMRESGKKVFVNRHSNTIIEYGIFQGGPPNTFRTSERAEPWRSTRPPAVSTAKRPPPAASSLGRLITRNAGPADALSATANDAACGSKSRA